MLHFLRCSQPLSFICKLNIDKDNKWNIYNNIYVITNNNQFIFVEIWLVNDENAKCSYKKKSHIFFIIYMYIIKVEKYMLLF